MHTLSGDAHPIHLHLVSFEVVGRKYIEGNIDDALVEQPVVQHNGRTGTGFKVNLTEVSEGLEVDAQELEEYVETGPVDVVTALPGQITKIRATFDRPGRYVWHCHILSHEDHEMMRVFNVTS